MMHFYKTQRGVEVLQNRSIPLTARQRRLLVLIGSKDFDLLHERLKQQLAPAELLEQLCEMDLIVPAHTSIISNSPHQTGIEVDTKINLAHSEIYRPLNSPLPVPCVTENRKNLLVPIEELQENSSIETNPDNQPHLPEPQALSFEDLKYLMMESLQKYCGLMAKQQIQHILQVQDVRSLKMCQIQWITSLQESRLPPQELNYILKQINFSLAQLQQNQAHE